MKTMQQSTQSITKKLTMALVFVLLAFGTTAYGNNHKPQNTTAAKGKEKSAVIKSARSLSAEEIKFYQEIENYYQEHIVKPAEKPVSVLPFQNVMVYGQDGKVVLEQHGKLDLNALPKGATKLFVEGNTAYYFVF